MEESCPQQVLEDWSCPLQIWRSGLALQIWEEEWLSRFGDSGLALSRFGGVVLPSPVGMSGLASSQLTTIPLLTRPLLTTGECKTTLPRANLDRATILIPHLVRARPLPQIWAGKNTPPKSGEGKTTAPKSGEGKATPPPKSGGQDQSSKTC